jgi:SAM-dependent methyltransferase
MPMNLLHRRLCSSQGWASAVAETLNPFLDGLDLGEQVLEVGPGYGATTRVLAERVPRLTVLEIDHASAERLRTQFDDRVTVLCGDATAMPLPDGEFSAVVCFTMLHHVPSAGMQDAVFAEARRVLRPGGLFAGYDSLPSLRFRLLHIGDTMVVLNPATLPNRLTGSGLTDVDVTHTPRRRVAFSARKPVGMTASKENHRH